MGVAKEGISDKARAGLFGFCGLMGVIPAVHCFLVAKPDEVFTMLPHLVGLVLCYGGGALVYVARVPERWWPGQFDFCGQSHNIWHLCALAGMLNWLVGMHRMAVLTS